MKILYVHPDNPQARLIEEGVHALSTGKIVIVPTDNGYRFALTLNAKDAYDDLKRLGVSEHDLTLICQNMSQLSEFAHVDNSAFATLKNNFNPQNVFILEPTKAVGKKIISKKSLHFTTTATPIMTMILDKLGEPFFVAPLIYQGELVREHYDISDKLDSQAECMIDVGVIDEIDVNVVDLLN